MVIYNKNEKGMGLLEVILAVAVFSVGISTVVHLYLGSNYASIHSVEKNQALLLAREGIEAVRSIRDGSASNLEKEEGDYELVMKGTLDKTGGETVQVWFEWGEGSLEEDLQWNTEAENMSSPGLFEKSVGISQENLAISYVYRAVVYNSTDDRTLKGEIVIVQ